MISESDRNRIERTRRDATVAITAGSWGGVYFAGSRPARCWRLGLGFVAITYVRTEFLAVFHAWLDAEDAKWEAAREDGQ